MLCPTHWRIIYYNNNVSWTCLNQLDIITSQYIFRQNKYTWNVRCVIPGHTIHLVEQSSWALNVAVTIPSCLLVGRDDIESVTDTTYHKTDNNWIVNMSVMLFTRMKRCTWLWCLKIRSFFLLKAQVSPYLHT